MTFRIKTLTSSVGLNRVCTGYPRSSAQAAAPLALYTVLVNGLAGRGPLPALPRLTCTPPRELRQSLRERPPEPCFSRVMRDMDV